MDLIIYAHPEGEKSHNASVLRYVREKLPGADVLDLYAENFDAILSRDEWAGKAAGDEKIAAMQKRLNDADRWVLIYPIWWYGAPAILKGFFDRVFTPGFAYNFKKMQMPHRLLMPILECAAGIDACYPLFAANMPVEKKLTGKRAVVINTFGSAKLAFGLFGRAPEFSVDKVVLEFCGVSPVKRVNWFEAREEMEIPPEVKRKIDSALGA